MKNDSDAQALAHDAGLLAQVIVAAAQATIRCGASKPSAFGGRDRCMADLTHVIGLTDRQPHVFYELGWPYEWTDDADGATPSPWPIEFVARIAEVR